MVTQFTVTRPDLRARRAAHAHRATRLACVTSISLLLVACDSSPATEPVIKTPVALEAVPFDAIGTGKVMFERRSAEHAIYLVDGTTHTSRIPFDNTRMAGPVISPDGSRIAFTRLPAEVGPDFNYDVFIADIDGTNEREMTNTTVDEGPPSWTSDGLSIAFHAANAGDHDRFMRRSAQPLSFAVEEWFRRPSTPGNIVCPYGEFSTKPALTNAGALAFTCRGAVYTVAGKGASAVRVYEGGDNHNAHAPDWSADGQRIVFVDVGPASLSVVSVDDANGGTASVVATVPAVTTISGAVSTYSLCLSRDGSRIFFNAPVSQSESHIWVVQTDGTGLRQITTRPNVFDTNVSCAF